MRIRTDGKHEHRAETIELAAEFWDCNKTTALIKSAEFARQMDRNIIDILSRDDLTYHQKREIAKTLTIPGIYTVEVSNEVSIGTK